jgi:hypothetical protein
MNWHIFLRCAGGELRIGCSLWDGELIESGLRIGNWPLMWRQFCWRSYCDVLD